MLCNLLFWLSIYVLFREEAIEDYVKDNYEHLNTMRSEPQTMQEMIDGTEVLMNLISVMGFITCALRRLPGVLCLSRLTLGTCVRACAVPVLERMSPAWA